MASFELNVLGGRLETCCRAPMTGFFRDGRCRPSAADHGRHVVCAEMTVEFLAFSRTRGNDLVTPDPDHDFPGLRPGDHWCLCAHRWKEAYDAGVAPPVLLAATHVDALALIPIAALRAHARVPSAG